MTLRFQEWLNAQQERNDEIGDLARTPDLQNVAQKATRQRSDEHQNWADIVIDTAQPGYVAVFNDAWREFSLAKQVATVEALD